MTDKIVNNIWKWSIAVIRTQIGKLQKGSEAVINKMRSVRERRLIKYQLVHMIIVHRLTPEYIRSNED